MYLYVCVSGIIKPYSTNRKTNNKIKVVPRYSIALHCAVIRTGIENQQPLPFQQRPCIRFIMPSRLYEFLRASSIFQNSFMKGNNAGLYSGPLQDLPGA